MITNSKTAVVVIVPAYNEEERIEETVRALHAVRDKLDDGVTLDVCVVDDGSTDDTAARAARAGVDQIVHHRLNQGLGAAIRTGFNAALARDADMVVKFDADLQHDPTDIPELIRPITEGAADLVYGNRFERIDYRMPLVRRWGNFIFTKLMAWLTHWPLRDSQPGIFAVSRLYLERFYLPGDYNYTQQVLLDAYHKGMRFAHVPVSFHERTTGRSFVSLRYPFKVLPQIFLVLTTLKPLRVFVPIGMIFLAIATGVLLWDVAQWLTGSGDEPVEHANAVIGFGLFGVQTLFFGVLGHLIIQQGRR